MKQYFLANLLFIYTLFIACTLLPSLDAMAHMGITNKVGGGYFGDQALHYIKSKWLAHKYKIPFYLQPFLYSDQLRASQQEELLTDSLRASFSRHISISNEADIKKNMQPETLFTIELWAQGYGFSVEDLVNFLLLNNDQAFLEQVRQCLRPLKTPPIPQIPEKVITVAVHIRKPVPFDFPLYSIQEYDSSLYPSNDEIIYVPESKTTEDPLNDHDTERAAITLYSDVHNGPMKFPPTQFYIDQIKRLSEFLEDHPLYVYFFTSDSNAEVLFETIKKAVNKKNITYAQHYAQWNAHIIDDSYLISQCNCLIKSTSTFSTISQLMGNHTITIFPGEYLWNNNILVINKSIWLIRKSQLETIKTHQDIKEIL